MFDDFSFAEIAKATMVLFAVIDIIGSIPLIINPTCKFHPKKHLKIYFF
jgi:small neutral amino acid transporter SnatA (MarC family)